MKRFSLILSIFLLVVVLVSCGTTLKKTSDKRDSKGTIVMEKTKTPIYQEETGQITFSRSEAIDPDYSTIYVFLDIRGIAGTVEPNAEVKVKVIGFGKEFEFQATAKKNGSFSISSYNFGFEGGIHEIIVTAQAPGKEVSKPLIFNYDIPRYGH